MPFDIGWNARATEGYVTDPTYGVPLLAETYPHTYTAANGYSVNAGLSIVISNNDRASGNDPRIAGRVYRSAAAGAVTFQVDLSSGSAPGAGDYAVDVALGDPLESYTGQSFQVKDNTTVMIDGAGGAAPYTTAAGHYIDASLADVAATTTWTGTQQVVTFATTTVVLAIAVVASGDYSTLAHFRLTLQGGAAATRLQHLAYGISNGIFLGR